MTLKDKTANVGVGGTPYYRRGRSYPQTIVELACTPILAALDDAGLTADDLDGFAYYSGGFDTSLIAQVLELEGAPDVRLVSNVVDVDPASVHIGMPVAVVWDDVDEHTTLPRFLPVEGRP
jgi:hypothetical protein